jgi:hypothetical protein
VELVVFQLLVWLQQLVLAAEVPQPEYGLFQKTPLDCLELLETVPKDLPVHCHSVSLD